MDLTRDERAVLDGSRGEIPRKLLLTMVRFGEAMDAERLVPVEGPGHLVIPESKPGVGARTEFLEALVVSIEVGAIAAFVGSVLGIPVSLALVRYEFRFKGMITAFVTAPLIAHVTDPWGGRFELLEDTEYTGVNHAHIFVADADATRDWFLEVFGGEFVPERGGDRFHTILYPDNVWIHISQADEPRMSSRWRTADHIGFRVPSLEAFRDTLVASGYEPYLERPNPPGADLLFFEGPGGLHIEMTEPLPQ